MSVKLDLDQLEKAFIRNRFAQKDVFSDGDIEQKLITARKSETPDLQKWRTFWCDPTQTWCLDLGSNKDQHLKITNLLRKTCTPATGKHHEAILSLNDSYIPLPEDVQDFLKTLIDGGANVYATTTSTNLDEITVHYVIVIRSCVYELQLKVFHKEKVLFNTWPSPQEIRLSNCVSSDSIISVLLSEWQTHSPNWQLARTHLCGQLEERIICEGKKAKEEFDKAVAVSEDGSKIVHADWVIVVPDELTLGNASHVRIYENTRFTHNKILREPNIQRVDRSDLLTNTDQWKDSALIREVAKCLPMFDKQTFVTLHFQPLDKSQIKDAVRFFVTTRRNMPDGIGTGDSL